MAKKTNAPDVADYGLTDPAILETATQLAPELFAALHIAQTLDVSHFPLTSDAAIEKALQAVANDGSDYALGGMKITSKGAKDYFPADFLPIEDRFDLLRKVYMAIIIAHRESARREWADVQSGAKKMHPSHAMPTEVV